MAMVAQEIRAASRAALRAEAAAAADEDWRAPHPLQVQLWLEGLPYPPPRPLPSMLEDEVAALPQPHHHHRARPEPVVQIPYPFAVGPFPNWRDPQAPRIRDWLPLGTDQAEQAERARRTQRRTHLPVFPNRADIALTPAARRELDRLGVETSACTSVHTYAPASAHTSEPAYERPRTRGDCAGGPRPCPWVSCRHNLFLDVTPSGSLKLNHPGIGVDEMRESCALDVADRGALSLPDIAREIGVTFERVRQIQTIAQQSVMDAAQRGRWLK